MKIIPWITVSAIGFMSIVLWRQSSQLAAIQLELSVFREVLAGERSLDVDIASDSSALKRLSDINEWMANVPPEDSDAYAKAVSVVDEWIFHPDDDELVTEALQELVNTLRSKLNLEIKMHLEAAIQADTGRDASASLAKAGGLFSLLPQPTTDDEKKYVAELSDQVSIAARRVDEIRRLRYNEWASEQIKSAFADFHASKRTFGDDDDALIDSFVENLGQVDASHLEPAVSGIYQQILSLTTDALADPKKVDLAKKLSSPANKHKSPFDF